MEIEDVNIWKQIEFNDSWLKTNTAKFDSILPSWLRKREILKEDSNEYKNFINRLKRQHSIETGIVEKLYDLKEGITETFIKEGFVESYLQHGDTNIPPKLLMSYLQDNFDAIDFVFDVVKNNRTITVSFIKELHQLITSHQDTAEGRDQFGNRLKIELLKGKFKTRENNPTREDGKRFVYCPPIHVDSEMDKFVEIGQTLISNNTHPIIIAAWYHHAFTQIHPFQDGNGRIARLLASLILIRFNLFPFTVRRNEKKRYIEALEKADNNEPQLLVDFFSDTQKRTIENALNLKLELASSTGSFAEVAEIFAQKLEIKKRNTEKERLLLISTNRTILFDLCSNVLNDLKMELVNKLNNNAMIFIGSCRPENEIKRHYFSHLIVAYAMKYDYFFNRTLPRGWFRFVIELPEDKKYQLIVTLHHFGYDDSTLAIGGILQYNEEKSDNERNDDLTTILPVAIEPYTISLENKTEQMKKSFDDLKSFLQNIITLTLAQIASEIS